MVEFKKYSFNRYTEKYPLLFKKEKIKLTEILPRAEIEHVGSTSVPGLGGKGIIDIAIKTPRNKVNSYLKKLKGLGYEYNKEHQRDDRRIFVQKRIIYNQKERRIHIHLVTNKKFWISFIAVRDYLKNHGKECKNYVKLKKEAVKYAGGVGKKYREYKSSYLEKIQKAALKENYKSQAGPHRMVFKLR